MLAHRGPRRAPDGRSRLAGDDDRFPCRRRRELRPRSQDLDLVAVGELGDQRRDLAVDLAADRVVPDVGMNRIGEIDRRRFGRQCDQLALRREAEHLVVEQFELGVLEELFRIGAFGKQLDRAPQPGIRIGLAREQFGGRTTRILVEGMRGDAVFGDLVHLSSTDLQLDALAARPDHGGVDRAIIVLLRGRDVILETAGHHRPGGVHDAERAIAFLHVADHDAEAENVGELLEADGFALHLAPDRVRPLLAAIDLRLDAAVGELAGELPLDVGNQVPIALGKRLQPRQHHAVGVRIELAERQVLQLFPHPVHAHPGGERRIDVERFLRDAPPRLRRHEVEGAHIVQPVRQFDQEDPHVVGDGEQQLAQVFRLGRLLRDQVELLELGQAVDQPADIRPEQLIDLGTGDRRVLDRVVQQGRGDGGIVELEVGENCRDFQRMGEIGVARGSLLRAMRLHRIDVGPIEQRLVGVAIVPTHALDQVILPHDRRLAGFALDFS